MTAGETANLLVEVVMSDAPKINSQPDVRRIRSLVDDLITPGEADRQAKALTTLLYSAANVNSNLQYEIAEEASRYAFSKTDAFETAFRDFNGFRQAPVTIDSDPTIELPDGVRH